MHTGWAGLILCMMWETAQGSASKWAPYLGMEALHNVPLKLKSAGSLPKTFDTPMFWEEEDLKELQGTAVVGLSLRVFPACDRSECHVQTKLGGTMPSETTTTS